MMAALYLLTADLRLWNLSKRHVGKIEINFADIRLKNIHENGYALFCCAKDLCLGTKHLTVADLADTDLIPPKAVRADMQRNGDPEIRPRRNQNNGKDG